MKLLLIALLAIQAITCASAQDSLDCSSLGYDSSKKIESLADTEGVDCLILQHYRQDDYQPKDPLADMALTCLAANYPKRIVWAFKKKTSENDDVVKKFYEQAELGRKCSEFAFDKKAITNLSYLTTLKKWADMEDDLNVISSMDLTDNAKKVISEQLLDGDYSLDGRKNPLITNGFIRMMKQVIQQESHRGINPIVETKLGWSEEFKAFIGKKHKFFTKKSKLLIALASGEAIKYMMTGREHDLYTFMMEQKEGSLYPHEMFRASYRLNQGDVYLSILTIQNLLSQHWLSPNRNKIDFITKLHPITHHLGSDEDVFGTWYHLFGSMAYGYSEGELSARFVTKIESLMSIAYGGSKNDFQENRINQQGAVIGSHLKKALKREEWNREAYSDEICPDDYLNKNEFKKIKFSVK